MVLPVDILRTDRAEAGAGAGAMDEETWAGGAGAAETDLGAGAEEWTRTTLSTGAPDWTGRVGATVGVDEVYFSLTITSSRSSSYLAPGKECS